MIGHLLFDLDGTLYSRNNPIDGGIGRRIEAFVCEYLQLPITEARALRHHGRLTYGTTIQWLKEEHQLEDEDAFFNYVHPDSEVDELIFDPHLRGFLQSLQLPMTVLTNSPRVHAERVLKFYNIDDLFLGVFDITYHHGKGKPAHKCFLDTLCAVNKTVAETIFIDDYPRYLQGYVELGGKAILIDEHNQHTDFAKMSSIIPIQSLYQLPTILSSLQGENDE